MVFISRNKITFALVVLLAGNIYQYIQRDQAMAQRNEEVKQLNQQIRDRDKQSIEYERERSDKLEFLLSNLAKSQPNGK